MDEEPPHYWRVESCSGTMCNRLHVLECLFRTGGWFFTRRRVGSLGDGERRPAPHSTGYLSAGVGEPDRAEIWLEHLHVAVLYSATG